MAIDIIYGGRVSAIGGANVEGDNVWLSKADLTTASGWQLSSSYAAPPGAKPRSVHHHKPSTERWLWSEQVSNTNS